MSAITDQMIETAAQVLSDEGADSEHGLHVWRCFDKVRFPEPCGCTEDVARLVLEAVAPIIAARAVLEAAADAEKLADAQERCGLPVAGHTRWLAENLRRRGERIARESDR